MTVIQTSHSLTEEILNRVKNGNLFQVKARVDLKTLTREKIQKCPFNLKIEADTIMTKVIGLNEEDAKNRIEKYVQVEEWIEVK